MTGGSDRMCCSQAGGACSACVKRFCCLWAIRDEVKQVLRGRDLASDVISDALSEAYVVAWRRLQDVPPDRNRAKAWLRVTARNLRMNIERRDRHQAALAASVAGCRRDSHNSDVVGQRVEAAEAFRSLSSSDRDLLWIVATKAPSIDELATLTMCSPTAAASRLWRARSRLERALPC